MIGAEDALKCILSGGKKRVQTTFLQVHKYVYVIKYIIMYKYVCIYRREIGTIC